MRAAARDARCVDSVRDDPRANALFLEVLTNRDQPDMVLRWMNEAGVFGRFVPDFGRIVAQMQFDMYHHYTVDEHCIRAIGLLAADRARRACRRPSAVDRLVPPARLAPLALCRGAAPRHRQGRGGDHSELGAEIALDLCPRFGLDPAETETVAWLVRHHLLLSQHRLPPRHRRPQDDRRFRSHRAKPERLRLLLILTVVDIRAVGPTTWTDWKRQMLRALFDAAEERLRLGHKQRGRSDQVAARHEALGEALGWSKAALKAQARRLPDSYWLAEPPEWQLANARQIAAAEARIGEAGAVDPCRARSGLGRDPPVGLRPRPARAILSHLRRRSPRRGRRSSRRGSTPPATAWRSTICSSPTRAGRPMATRATAPGWCAASRPRLNGDAPAPPLPPPMSRREEAFAVAPSVLIADKASTRTTVIEVNARDRPGLLAGLAHAIHAAGHTLHSAHIATYGERAVDVFYRHRRRRP